VTIFTVKANPHKNKKQPSGQETTVRLEKWCLPLASQLGHRNGQGETALPPELDSGQQLLEESFSAGHRPCSHMQTHLSLPEHPSTLITTFSVQ
jgi:hypothetical protein